MTKIGLIVPTLNAGALWPSWLTAFERQTRRPDRLLVIDSSSDDDTVALARSYGFGVHVIAKADFNHGGTRQLGIGLLHDAEIIVFMTQDALLAGPDAIERLLEAFADERVGAAYGRQLPHRDAKPIGAHARLFNYPPQSRVRSLEDRRQLGIKTAFISNSFAAYRRSALLDVGGFPTDTVMNEDTFVAGKMLLSGWKVAYRADARVHHSHDYAYADEFKRYFDIGVFHARTPWLQETFGKAAGEGRRYVVSELRYLAKNAPRLVPSAVLRSGLKWLGFKMGSSLHRKLPLFLNRRLSLHRAYWRRALP
ncbi:family 2 glycosyl transferase [Methylocaldum marinum]|uniref:Family 2 glycosyl transferase n=1 Tax=Methylocaldum marinum TaxID=1432792 RepID=A0A250KX56_9GAMM|nr:glycosyltransferase [Methylocaldum marinum]BBA36240.1 family 2 glycosyl transferase [Methylocaldum marinum]